MAAAKEMEPIKMESAKRAVIAVGRGRGFVVEGSRGKLCVITAAHCLPPLPPAHPGSHPQERTYENLLGRIGESPTVSAECLFVDPVADIAVLGEPDAPDLNEQHEAYCDLMPDEPIPIGDTPRDYQPIMIKTFDGEMVEAKNHHQSLTTEAWLLSLDGKWFACEVEHRPDGPLWIKNAAEPIVGGMSGSPILSKAGTAIGVVCISKERLPNVEGNEGGPNPRLTANLPGWMLHQMIKGD
jgi:trypsin-like peptidase